MGGLSVGGVEADGFEWEAEGAIVGFGDEVEGVADNVVDFSVFLEDISLGLGRKKSDLRKGSTRLFGAWGNAGPLATKIARIRGCS